MYVGTYIVPDKGELRYVKCLVTGCLSHKKFLANEQGKKTCEDGLQYLRI